MYAEAAMILAALASLGAVTTEFVGQNGTAPAHANAEYLAAGGIAMTATAAAAATAVCHVTRATTAATTRRPPAAMAEFYYDAPQPNAATGNGALSEAAAAQETEAELAHGSVILCAIATVGAMSLMAGLGQPYEGAEFNTGSTHLTTAHGQLADGIPDDGWQGLASQAYAGRSARQQGHTQSMASLDHQLAFWIKSQADWVTHTRMILGVVTSLLAAAYFYEVWMRPQPPPGGLIASESYAAQISAAGILTATATLGLMCVVSYFNAGIVDDLATQYQQAATGSGTPAAPTTVSVPIATTQLPLVSAIPEFAGFNHVASGSAVPFSAQLAHSRS